MYVLAILGSFMLRDGIMEIDRIKKKVIKKHPDLGDKFKINNNLNEKVFVNADPDRIHQVFNNLLSNAIRYTDEGQIAISIEKNDNKVYLSVSDTGVGIETESIERIFERFYRTDNARSRAKNGTGLGLSIVNHIIKAHGSTVKVESRLGEGTEFSFELEVYSKD